MNSQSITKLFLKGNKNDSLVVNKLLNIQVYAMY